MTLQETLSALASLSFNDSLAQQLSGLVSEQQLLTTLALAIEKGAASHKKSSLNILNNVASNSVADCKQIALNDLAMLSVQRSLVNPNKHVL